MSMRKGFLTAFLAAGMALALAVTAIAAQTTSGTAATLRLEATEGTVGVENASGKEVTLRDGMRLYSGYAVSTQKASYAYISLDETKAVKLDASSAGEVLKSGKKLEMKVTAGKMFFNVTVPVEADESLTIRTSTMVTGVRGTAGWVEVVDRYTTRIYLLEGELSITCTDPLTGRSRSATITGGQTATVVYHGEERDFESELLLEDVTIQELIEEGVIREEHIIELLEGLTVETLQEEDVPGYVSVEVAKDEELQKRIEENTDLSVPEIIDGAEERLAEEEAAAEEADEAIQEALEDMSAEKVDPLFEEVRSSSGGGTTAPVAFTLDDPTDADVEAAIAAGYTNLNITNANDSNVWTIVDAHVANPLTVNVSNGEVLMANGSTLNVAGTLSIGSESSMVNTGTVNITSTNSLRVSGILDNQGTINVGVGTTPGTLAMEDYGYIENSGTINVVNGTLTMGADATIDNPVAGVINVEAAGVLTNGGTLNNNGTVTVSSGSVTNSGTFNNNGTATLILESTEATNAFTNTGSFNNYGTVKKADGVDYAGFDNRGTLTNYTSSVMEADVTNSGTYEVPEGEDSELPSNVTLKPGSTLYNKGNLEVSSYSEVTFEAGINVINEGNVTVSGTLNAYSSLTATLGITVNEYGVLNVGNGTDAATLTIPAGQSLSSRGTVNVNASGTVKSTDTSAITNNGGAVNVNGGAVESTDGHGISNNGGEVTVKGGTVTGGQTGIVNTGSITVEGTGRVTGVSAGIGNTTSGTDGFITVRGNGIVEGTGASGDGILTRHPDPITVEGNAQVTGTDDGIYNSSSGSVTVTGGTVRGNSTGIFCSTSAEETGSAVKIEGGVVSGETALTASNVTITDGQVSGTSYGLTISMGSADISGGTVSGGTHSGIYSTGTSNITVSGDAVITGGDFGGIYGDSSGSLTVGGNAQVSGTYYGIRLDTSTTPSTVTIKDNARVTATDTTVNRSPFALSNDTANITITGGTFTSAHPSTGYAISNTKEGTITITGGVFAAITGISNTGALTIDGTPDFTNTTTIIRNNSESGDTVIRGEVTIDGVALTIPAGQKIDNRADVIVSNGGSLIIQGALDNNTNNVGVGSLTVSGGGSLVIEATGEVINHADTPGGSTITVGDGGTMINRGNVENRMITYQGNNIQSTLSVEDGGTLTSSGSMDLDSPLSVNGAGAKLNITDGTVEGSANHLIENNGGTVEITGGTVSSYARGIVNNLGTVEVSGTGKVLADSGTAADVGATGIENAGGTVTISDTAQVSGTATGDGALGHGIYNSVYVDPDTLTTTAYGTATIAGGAVTGSHYGVYNDDGAALTVTGGTISVDDAANWYSIYNVDAANPITVNSTAVALNGLTLNVTVTP